MLVSICAVALVPVVPFIALFAVANSALINMLMASRLLHGMAKQGVLPPQLASVHQTRRTPWMAIAFTTLLSFGLILYVVLSQRTEEGATTVSLLGGTTSLLLLCVFTVVNIALIVLRRRPVDHDHFHAPAALPWIGAVTCAFLVGPWARSEGQQEQYQIALYLLVIGVVLWAVTYFVNKGQRPMDPTEVEELDTRGPVN